MHKDAKKTETVPNKTAARGSGLAPSDTTTKTSVNENSSVLDSASIDTLLNDSIRRLENDTTKSKRAKNSPFEDKVIHE